MNEAELFIMFLLIFVLPFIIGGISRVNELNQQPTQPKKDYRITIEPVVIMPPKTTVCNFTDEAKAILVSCGFTATEAKKLISEAGSYNTVEELVEAALMRAKI